MTMNDQTGEPLHPGPYVKQRVLPKSMTVTKAAALLGVGRPALSTFLNGKSSLSQDMARRLERTFEADREDLLALQAQYDSRVEAQCAPVVAEQNAPTLVEIKANQISEWADGTRAREELPALLRRLVRATGIGLARADFPAFDNAQRPGPDGQVETTTPAPWIPVGRSLWEFGCDGRPVSKANSDYAQRVRTVPSDERHDTTFVFVTPHNWRGKGEWAAEKAIHKEWRDVRAYDASDLEQWLEQSAETQVWFSERLGDPVTGYRSPDMGWSNWAETCEPPLTPRLFSVADDSIENFQQWLASPPERPFVVAADSPGDALAFACHLVREATSGTEEPAARGLVFDTPEAIHRYRRSNASPRVAIVHHDRVEEELGDLHLHCHCIIVRPGNDVDRKPDIRLGLPDWQEFSDALEAMGLSRDDIDRLARESGRSPAVLRRRLSEIPRIRTPDWARDAPIARKLLPTALVGAWRRDSAADCEIVRALARAENDNDVESNVAELLNLPDSPLWSTGSHRGVVSRIDALFGIAKFLTEPDLDKFFSVAERVLSELDPALDLPEGERWAAVLHGKTRSHSPALRKGVCETLTLLSLHGGNLFRDGLGVDPEIRVLSLIRKLLTPLTTDKLLSHLDDLPAYAEAAPDTFLTLIETDLRESEPAVFGLLKPVEGGPFGPGQQRIGLLWALECLGWRYLGRVSRILAQLSVAPIDDNWVNRPIASLEALYRSWLPQTSAALDERIRSLQMLVKLYPDVGWRICVAQLKTGPQFASPSYRPHWSGDASGAGRGVTRSDFYRFRRGALDLVLSWTDHDHGTLGELVELFHDFGDEERIRIWELIERWAVSETDDKARAALRERIRQHALTRRSRRRGVSEEALERACVVYDRLEPCDPVVRHRWLFSGSWIEPSADENDENVDYEAHDERIGRLRDEAMKEIWQERGFEGVTALLADCGAPSVVGACLEAHIAEAGARVDFLDRCLSVTGPLHETVELCVCGFLHSVDDDARGALLASTAEGGEPDRVARLYSLAPVRSHTWRLLDEYGEDVRERYWRQVMPEWHRHTDADLTELIDRLLDVQRARPAFFVAHLDWSRIETTRLKRLLYEIGAVDTKSDRRHVPAAHDISNAFDELDRRGDIDRDEMMRLEFMYLPVLEHSRHGLPNLEHRIAESPIDFVQLLALVFKRDDDGQDPPDWQIGDPEKRGEFANRAYGLLERTERIPGIGEEGVVDAEALRRWVVETRLLCAKYGRAKVGDKYIGRLLSRAPGGQDGIMPSPAVSAVLEEIGSSEVGSGFAIGVFNGRGVTMRAVGEGGAQERELAQQYRNWASRRSPDFPFVGSVLENIAAGYDRDARWEDEEVQVERRLNY